MSAARPETLLEKLFYTTVRIEASLRGGGTSTGTGFVYTVPLSEGVAQFLVTNKHVVANARGITLHLLRADGAGGPLLGAVHSVTLTALGPDIFFPHPDSRVDVVAISLAKILNDTEQQGTPIFFAGIPSSAVPTLAQIDELDAIETVRFVGYPAGLYDTINHLPVVRNGTVASYLQHDYQGVPQFLIDASVFPGSSGSPVLIAETGAWTTKNGSVNLGAERVMLLGVVAAVQQTERHGRLEITPTDTVAPVVNEMIDLGIVFKSRTIDECIDLALSRYGLKRQDVSAASEPTAARRDARPS